MHLSFGPRVWFVCGTWPIRSLITTNPGSKAQTHNCKKWVRVRVRVRLFILQTWIVVWFGHDIMISNTLGCVQGWFVHEFMLKLCYRHQPPPLILPFEGRHIMVWRWDVDLETTQHISELNSLENAIAPFSSEMCWVVSKSTSHPHADHDMQRAKGVIPGHSIECSECSSKCSWLCRLPRLI